MKNSAIMPGRGALSPVLQSVAFGLAYYASAKLSHDITGTRTNILTSWLPSGLFLGVLLRTERRHWLGLVLAGGLGDLAYNYFESSFWPLKFVLLAHLGNSASAVLGAWLVRRMVAERPTLDSVREFFGMLAFGGLLSLPLSATIGALLSEAWTPGRDWWFTWVFWYCGDLLGVLLLTPVLLSWSDGIRRPALWRLTPRLMEAVGLWLGVGVTINLSYYFQWPQLILPLFVAIPFVIWAAFRFGLRSVSTLIFFCVLLAQWFIHRGYGVIGRSTLPDTAKNLELLVGFGGFSLLSLFPAVVLAAQHRTAAALREWDRVYRALNENINQGYYTADQHSRFTYCNPSFFALCGYRPDELTGESCFHLIAEEDRERVVNTYREWSRDPSAYDVQCEFHAVAKSGRLFWVEQSTNFLRDADGRMVEGRNVLRDITARKQAELQIRNQANLLNQTQDIIIVADLDNRFTFWNKATEHLTGWSAAEALGQTAELVFGPGTRDRLEIIREAVLATGAWQGEFPLNHKDGRSVILDLRVTLIRDDAGRPSGRISTGTDITEKKQLEEQVQRTQRIESLGLLAAGIAHDLNNILSPVLMAAPLLRTRATHPSDLRVLDLVEKSALRGSALVQQILSFAHGANTERVLLQARHILLEVNQLMAVTFPKSIAVENDIPADLWPVVSNSTQLHQVVLNLCINARDAMPTGGTLTLTARNEALVAAPDCLPSGSYLIIEVADTGTGMTPEVLTRIWEPFFTTKAEEQGTGLGLATARGILAQLGGTISVESTPGRGSVFRVYHPATLSEVAATTASGSQDPAANSHRPELVLVVDDDTEVRKLMSLSLTQWGYRVLQAKDSAEAMEHFLVHSSDISLVIFDLDLPGQDGLTLARQLQGLRPDLRVLFVTGVDSLKSFLLPRLPADAPLLKKPFARQSLREEIERTLAAPVFAL